MTTLRFSARGLGIMADNRFSGEGRGITVLVPSLSELIKKTPGVLGGAARIGNTRIAVWMLVNSKRLGFSDAEIRQHYEQPLTQAELDAAWAYHRDHWEEIEQAIRENEDA